MGPNAKLRKNVQRLSKTNGQLEKDSHSLLKTVQSQKEENRDLSQKVKDLEKGNKVAELTEEIEKLSKEAEELKADIEMYKERQVERDWQIRLLKGQVKAFQALDQSKATVDLQDFNALKAKEQALRGRVQSYEVCERALVAAFEDIELQSLQDIVARLKTPNSASHLQAEDNIRPKSPQNTLEQPVEHEEQINHLENEYQLGDGDEAEGVEGEDEGEGEDVDSDEEDEDEDEEDGNDEKADAEKAGEMGEEEDEELDEVDEDEDHDDEDGQGAEDDGGYDEEGDGNSDGGWDQDSRSTEEDDVSAYDSEMEYIDSCERWRIWQENQEPVSEPEDYEDEYGGDAESYEGDEEYEDD